jgi:hypothetical protein
MSTKIDVTLSSLGLLRHNAPQNVVGLQEVEHTLAPHWNLCSRNSSILGDNAGLIYLLKPNGVCVRCVTTDVELHSAACAVRLTWKCGSPQLSMSRSMTPNRAARPTFYWNRTGTRALSFALLRTSRTARGPTHELFSACRGTPSIRRHSQIHEFPIVDPHLI